MGSQGISRSIVGKEGFRKGKRHFSSEVQCQLETMINRELTGLLFSYCLSLVGVTE